MLRHMYVDFFTIAFPKGEREKELQNNGIDTKGVMNKTLPTGPKFVYPLPSLAGSKHNTTL